MPILDGDSGSVVLPTVRSGRDTSGESFMLFWYCRGNCPFKCAAADVETALDADLERVSEESRLDEDLAVRRWRGIVLGAERDSR